MLRLNVAMLNAPYYKIPPDNPFVNDPNVKDEIWALGLRNAWRWSFDRLTGDTWIADVGQDKIEEVDFRTKAEAAGTNYGWRCYEGNSTYNTSGCLSSNNYTFPIFSYTHNFTNGGFAIIGGYVYRGSAFPALQGYYICGDDVITNAWLTKPNGAGGWIITRQGGGIPAGLSGFGEDEDGELYAATTNGFVYRVIDKDSSSKFSNVYSAEKLIAKVPSRVYPSIINNGFVNLDVQSAFRLVRIVDMNGSERLRKDIKGVKGSIAISVARLDQRNIYAAAGWRKE